MNIQVLKRRGSEMSSEDRKSGWAPSSAESLNEALSHYWFTEMRPRFLDLEISDDDAVAALVEGYLHGG